MLETLKCPHFWKYFSLQKTYWPKVYFKLSLVHVLHTETCFRALFQMFWNYKNGGEEKGTQEGGVEANGRQGNKGASLPHFLHEMPMRPKYLARNSEIHKHEGKTWMNLKSCGLSWTVAITVHVRGHLGTCWVAGELCLWQRHLCPAFSHPLKVVDSQGSYVRT